MKFFTLKSITALAILALSANALAMDVEFNDAAWDGKKIPEGQQCLNYNGKSPATPSMTVSNIPAGAESLVFVYNDVSNKCSGMVGMVSWSSHYQRVLRVQKYHEYLVILTKYQ